MCGRYALKYSEVIKKYFELHGEMPRMADRYNIAPTQTAPVIGVNPETGDRTLVEMRWGLIPHWAKDTSIGNKMFNARSETLTEKPAFKGLVAKRRCVVPATGFYEWEKAGKERLPYYFQLKSGKPMGLAGLWSAWHHEGITLNTFTIITGEANAALSDIHHRMPMILTRNEIDAWLDPSFPVEAAMDALNPVEADEIERWRVSKAINRSVADGASLIEREPVNSL